MDDLTTKQRAHLRGLGHALKPLLHIGKEGVTADAIESLRQAFANRELLKVRVLETAPAPARESTETLAAGVTDVHVVQVVGRTALVYRRHPDEPQIRLPQPRRRVV